MAEYGLPQRVVDFAVENGVHRDCLDRGPTHACGPCMGIVFASIHRFYSHVPSEKVESAVTTDLIKETQR